MAGPTPELSAEVIGDRVFYFSGDNSEPFKDYSVNEATKKTRRAVVGNFLGMLGTRVLEAAIPAAGVVSFLLGAGPLGPLAAAFLEGNVVGAERHFARRGKEASRMYNATTTALTTSRHTRYSSTTPAVTGKIR